MYTILSKSEGVPFQISFFLGDLTWNDPSIKTIFLIGKSRLSEFSMCDNILYISR